MPLFPEPVVDTGPRYTVTELAQAGGVGIRTIRHYVAEGLLEKTAFEGPNTRYGREHLVIVLAIRKLKESGVRRLPEIKRRLAGLSVEELAREVLPAPAAPAAPAAAPAPSSGVAGEAWRRVELIPGLELWAREGAGEVVTRLAGEIRERYGV